MNKTNKKLYNSVRKKIERSIAFVKTSNMKIKHEDWGVERGIKKNWIKVTKTTCCPMGAVLLHRQPEPGKYGFQETAAAQALGIEAEDVDMFVTYFDDPSIALAHLDSREKVFAKLGISLNKKYVGRK